MRGLSAHEIADGDQVRIAGATAKAKPEKVSEKQDVKG